MVPFHIRAKEEDNSRRKHCSSFLQLYEQRFFEMSSAYFTCSKSSKLINIVKSSQKLGQMRAQYNEQIICISGDTKHKG